MAVLPGKRDKVLAAIEAAEARRKAIEAMYAEAGFFERTGKDEVDRLGREDTDLKGQIEKWLAEWEAIEKEIAMLESGLG